MTGVSRLSEAQRAALEQLGQDGPVDLAAPPNTLAEISQKCADTTQKLRMSREARQGTTALENLAALATVERALGVQIGDVFAPAEVAKGRWTADAAALHRANEVAAVLSQIKDAVDRSRARGGTSYANISELTETHAHTLADIGKKLIENRSELEGLDQRAVSSRGVLAQTERELNDIQQELTRRVGVRCGIDHILFSRQQAEALRGLAKVLAARVEHGLLAPKDGARVMLEVLGNVPEATPTGDFFEQHSFSEHGPFRDLVDGESRRSPLDPDSPLGREVFAGASPRVEQLLIKGLTREPSAKSPFFQPYWDEQCLNVLLRESTNTDRTLHLVNRGNERLVDRARRALEARGGATEAVVQQFMNAILARASSDTLEPKLADGYRPALYTDELAAIVADYARPGDEAARAFLVSSVGRGQLVHDRLFGADNAVKRFDARSAS